MLLTEVMAVSGGTCIDMASACCSRSSSSMGAASLAAAAGASAPALAASLAPAAEVPGHSTDTAFSLPCYYT